ncbi:hypothetical protein [Solibacillus sp. NPDC093137]|uniref:hypothetical protein n=1 Tax=Solibacillus sp. NPDC093137 TaxID=3390678 RepID=UPI003CFDF573
MSFFLGIIFTVTVIGTIFAVKRFALAQPAAKKAEDFPIVMNRSLMPSNRGTLEIVDTTNLPAYSKEDVSSVFPKIVSNAHMKHVENVEVFIEDDRNNNQSEQSLESIFAMYGQNNVPGTTTYEETSVVEPVVVQQQVITQEKQPQQYEEVPLDETTEAFVNFLSEGLQKVEPAPVMEMHEPMNTYYDQIAATYVDEEEIQNDGDYVFGNEQTHLPVAEEQIQQPMEVTAEEVQQIEPSNLETGEMTVNTNVKPLENKLNIFGDEEEEQNNEEEIIFADNPVLSTETISAAPVVAPFIISSIPNATKKKKEVLPAMTKEEKFLNDVTHQLLNVSPVEKELINNSVEDNSEEVEPVVLSLDDLYDPNNLDARFMRIAEYFADVCENTLSEGTHGFKTFVVQVVGTESECIHVTDGTGRIWFDVEAFQEKEFQRGDILLIESNFGEVVTCSRLSNIELEDMEQYEITGDETYSLAL